MSNPTTDLVRRLRDEYVQQSARCGEEDSQDRSLLAQEAADEIERLNFIQRDFHNVDDLAEIASWKAVAHDHSERLKKLDKPYHEREAPHCSTCECGADDVTQNPSTTGE